MSLTIHRLASATANHYEAFLLALEGETAVAAFRAGRAAGDLLAQDSFYLLLASLDGQPAGALTAVAIPKLDARRGFLFVDELSVLPAFRRRGVARALLAQVESLARDLGLTGVRLLVRPNNHAAAALYRAEGYALSASRFCEKSFAPGPA